MHALSENSAFDEAIAPILQIVLPERVDPLLQYQPDANLTARIEELAVKSTEEERAEYAGYVRANKFVAILKRQAERLRSSSGK